jgi:hypothetical protein
VHRSSTGYYGAPFGVDIVAPDHSPRVPRGRRAQHDARLRVRGTGVPAEHPKGAVQVVGVGAGHADLVVEAAGDERDLAHRGKRGHVCFEGFGRDGVGEADIDDRVETPPERLAIDERGEAEDDAGELQAAHAVRYPMWAEPDLSAQARERRSSVLDQRVDDPLVNLVQHD